MQHLFGDASEVLSVSKETLLEGLDFVLRPPGSVRVAVTQKWVPSRQRGRRLH